MSPEINSLMAEDRPMQLVSSRQSQPTASHRNGTTADDGKNDYESTYDEFNIEFESEYDTKSENECGSYSSLSGSDSKSDSE